MAISQRRRNDFGISTASTCSGTLTVRSGGDGGDGGDEIFGVPRDQAFIALGVAGLGLGGAALLL